MKRHGYFASLVGIPAGAAQVLRPPRRLFAPEPFALETTAAPALHLPPRPPSGSASPRSETGLHTRTHSQPAAVDPTNVEPAPVESLLAVPSPAAEPRLVASAPLDPAEGTEPPRSLTPRQPPDVEAERSLAPAPHASVSVPTDNTREAMRDAAESRVVVPAADAAPPLRDEHRDHAAPARDVRGDRVESAHREPGHRAPRAPRAPLARPPSLHIGAIEVTVAPAQQPQVPPVTVVETAPPRAEPRPLQRPGLAPWYGLGQR